MEYLGTCKNWSTFTGTYIMYLLHIEENKTHIIVVNQYFYNSAKNLKTKTIWLTFNQVRRKHLKIKTQFYAVYYIYYCTLSGFTVILGSCT